MKGQQTKHNETLKTDFWKHDRSMVPWYGQTNLLDDGSGADP